MAKTFLQWSVKGTRRRGSQRKMREDIIIRDRAGLKFGESVRAVEDIVR